MQTILQNGAVVNINKMNNSFKLCIIIIEIDFELINK